MLHGFVTERDLQAIEETFPGIWRFYLDLVEKPSTFLDLMWRFVRGCDAGCTAAAPAPSERTSSRS